MKRVSISNRSKDALGTPWWIDGEMDNASRNIRVVQGHSDWRGRRAVVDALFALDPGEFQVVADSVRSRIREDDTPKGLRDLYNAMEAYHA